MNKKQIITSLLLALTLSSCTLLPTVTSSNVTSSSDSLSSSESSSLEESNESSIVEESESNEESSESNEEISSNEELSSEEDSSLEESNEEVIEDEETLFYDDFYNHSSEVKLTIRISDEDAYRVCQFGAPDDMSTHDIYSPIDLTVSVNGKSKTFKECGIRLKGNTSRNEGQYCFDEYGHINGHAHFKISFNTTFSDNDFYTPNEDASTLKARRFSKAKKFDLKWNKNYDGYYTKEAYASYVGEQEGLLTQKINLAKVKIITDSDEKEFTYQILECIDEEFIERRLPKAQAKGDLYKGGWNGHDNVSLTETSNYLRGVEDVTQYQKYVYDLKTNKKKSTHAMLDNLIASLNEDDYGKSEDYLKEKLNSLVDVDYFLKWAALEWVIGNPDSMRYNYNNTYLYFNSENNLLYPIMYDNDRCFGILKDWEVCPNRWPTTTKTVGNDFKDMQRNPLYLRMICGGNDSYPLIQEYQDRYIEYVEEYAYKYLDRDKYYDFVNEFKTVDNIDDQYNLTFEYYADEMLYQLEEYLYYR